jgi:hypothetical protein
MVARTAAVFGGAMPLASPDELLLTLARQMAKADIVAKMPQCPVISVVALLQRAAIQCADIE